MKINEENANEWDDKTGEGEGGQGEGGLGGKIHFKFSDAAMLPPRDDALPPSEIRRLLTVHKEIHKQRVDRQKLTRKEREALKEGPKHLQEGYRQALSGGGGGSSYKRHPISNKAQFSGIDKQTIGIPSEFDAETNLEMRDRLENRLENRLQNRNVPKFNPRPRPPGG